VVYATLPGKQAADVHRNSRIVYHYGRMVDVLFQRECRTGCVGGKQRVGVSPRVSRLVLRARAKSLSSTPQKDRGCLGTGRNHGQIAKGFEFYTPSMEEAHFQSKMLITTPFREAPKQWTGRSERHADANTVDLSRSLSEHHVARSLANSKAINLSLHRCLLRFISALLQERQ
jgi:hypothetical protein